MNVIELYRLTQWVNEEIVQQDLPQKYSQLHSVLQQNSQPNQPKAAFENQQTELIDLITEIDLTRITRDQTSFLDELEILPALGQNGVDRIEDILFRNALDVTTAAQKIQEIQSKLNEGLRKIELLSEGLEGCIYDDEEATEDVLIRVSFLDKASISNVNEFKDWGAKWHLIGHGISMAHGLSTDELKITGAAKGSVILELMACAAISTTISKIILDALKVVEKVQSIRKETAAIQNLNLQNKKIVQELEKAAKEEKKTAVEEIVADKIKELGLKKGNDGDKVNALETAIKTLIDFIDLGGEVDFVVPEEEEYNEEEPVEDPYAKIREQSQEIRALEDKLKLIEDHTGSEE